MKASQKNHRERWSKNDQEEIKGIYYSMAAWVARHCLTLP